MVKNRVGKSGNALMLVLFSLLLAGNDSYGQEDDRGYIVKVGQNAPDFTVTTTEGKYLSYQRTGARS